MKVVCRCQRNLLHAPEKLWPRLLSACLVRYCCLSCIFVIVVLVGFCMQEASRPPHTAFCSGSHHRFERTCKTIEDWAVFVVAACWAQGAPDPVKRSALCVRWQRQWETFACCLFGIEVCLLLLRAIYWELPRIERKFCGASTHWTNAWYVFSDLSCLVIVLCSTPQEASGPPQTARNVSAATSG